MTIQEQNHLDLIEEIIAKKMKLIYWIIGVAMFMMLSIFITVALPIQNTLIEVVRVQQTKAFEKEVDAIYLQKQDYYQIEEDEHRVLKEVIKNPGQADYLMGVINNNIVEKLGFKLTVRGGKK